MQAGIAIGGILDLNLNPSELVGAAMCSAFECGSHDRWLPRPSKYRGRRHTKRARIGGRARVELRKTSQQAFPPRS